MLLHSYVIAASLDQGWSINMVTPDFQCQCLLFVLGGGSLHKSIQKGAPLWRPLARTMSSDLPRCKTDLVLVCDLRAPATPGKNTN